MLVLDPLRNRRSMTSARPGAQHLVPGREHHRRRRDLDVKAKLQIERAREQRQQQRWDELSYRLWRLGITRVTRVSTPTASTLAKPQRISRRFNTTIRIR